MRRGRRSDPAEVHRAAMLAVADRLLGEFPHLPFLTVAETMNAVRRQTVSGVDGPDPDTVYRFARSRLADTALEARPGPV